MFRQILFTLLALFTLASGRPSSIPSAIRSAEAVTAADMANVYVCEHVHFGGSCVNVLYALGSGDCTSLDGTASSIRPDKGFRCTFYKNGSCRTFDGSTTLTLKDPGSADLTAEEGGWNDAARGFQCYRA